MTARRPLGWRLSLILVGILMLIWLPIEDRSILVVFLFAAGISFLFGIAIKSTLFQRWPERWRFLLAGAAGGLAVTPIVLLLMAVKTGIHGHGTPDYTAEQLANVMKLTPFWILAGSFIGLIAWRILR